MNKTNEFKTSFSAITESSVEILILGSMPSDSSLQKQEYYAHPQNRFWKIVATITNNAIPIEYTDKLAILKNNSIALWDVVYQAIRPGSMDSSIEQETPNDIETLLHHHQNIKTIAFNGKKSEALFDKYFVRKSHIQYISLPSSSPANARITFEALCERWNKLLSD